MTIEEMQTLQTLIKNLPEYGVKIVKLASELGCHPNTLYHYAQGYKIPESTAKRILTHLKDNYGGLLRGRVVMFDEMDSVGEMLSDLGFSTGGNNNDD